MKSGAIYEITAPISRTPEAETAGRSHCDHSNKLGGEIQLQKKKNHAVQVDVTASLKAAVEPNCEEVSSRAQ
jgi:hypothetical protein